MPDKLQAMHFGPDKDDPAVTKAFLQFCPKLVQVAWQIDASVDLDQMPEEALFTQDLAWIKRSITNEGELPGFADAFAVAIGFHGERLDIAAQHVTAMKILAKHLSQGYEVSASHVRAVVDTALSVRSALDSSIQSEERVTRFAADQLAQQEYATRALNSATWNNIDTFDENGAPIDDEEDSLDAKEQLAQHFEACGFEVCRDRRDRSRMRSVAHGQHKVEIRTNASRVAKEMNETMPFAWNLTSGAAHVEQWAMSSFNEGSVDFYITMASAALCPSFKSILTDLGVYFGADVTGPLSKLEAAHTSFLEACRPVYERALARLPEDDPRRILFNAGRAMELMMQMTEAEGHA
jgi:hypothetical protein